MELSSDDIFIDDFIISAASVCSFQTRKRDEKERSLAILAVLSYVKAWIEKICSRQALDSSKE